MSVRATPTQLDGDDLQRLAAGENFPVASRLLPKRQRADLLAVYGVARLVDDIGDESTGDRLAELDWAEGGQTNITDECLACGPHNRLVKRGGWKTRKRKDGRTEWIPPPHLDSGQSRMNNYHHPQKYLAPQDDD